MSGNRLREATRWFQQARYDLEAVNWNIQGKFYDTACFLSQQAAEKALKSLMYYLGARRKAIFTHSLMDMVKEGQKHVGALADAINDAKELDLHYVPSRYPNGLPSGFPHQFYGIEMAEKALHAATKIFAIIQEFYQLKREQEILKFD